MKKNAPLKQVQKIYPSLRTSLQLNLVQEDSRPNFKTLPKANSSKECYSNFLPLFEHCMYIKEEFHILILNAGGRIVGHSKISEGGTCGTLVDLKTVFSTALLVPGARSIVAAHNHPSQELKPSIADNHITKRLVKAGLLLDMPLLDHLIIGEDDYFSFADEGLI